MSRRTVLLLAAMLAQLFLSFSIQPQLTHTALQTQWARWLPPIWFLGTGRLTVIHKNAGNGAQVGFVHTPRAVRRPQFWAAAPVQFGSIALHPTPDGDVVDGKISLGHEFFQIPEAESKPKIPADTQDDDPGFKMSPFEQC